MTKMTSIKPYMIRACYDWIVENNLTPYILVHTGAPSVQVPKEHIQEERIVLNISPTATRGLLIENDRILFTARFSGKTEQIFVPPGAVLEIFAKENSKGMSFELEEIEPVAEEAINQVETAAKTKPALKLVKKEKN